MKHLSWRLKLKCISIFFIIFHRDDFQRVKSKVEDVASEITVKGLQEVISLFCQNAQSPLFIEEALADLNKQD